MKLYTSWGQSGDLLDNLNLKRLLNSVILDKEIADDTLNDVKEFMGNGNWYFIKVFLTRRIYYMVTGSGNSFIQAPGWSSGL